MSKKTKMILFTVCAILLVAGAVTLLCVLTNRSESGNGTKKDIQNPDDGPHFEPSDDPAEKQNSRVSDGFEFVPDENGSSYVLISCSPVEGCREIRIPSEVDGTPVTAIGEKAFARCDSVEKVEVPASVTEIGYRAFDDTVWFEKLKEENDYVIVNGVLLAAKDTEHAQIPDGVRAIVGAFEGCGELKRVSIPASVTLIGECAFSKCTGLTEITIPDSVTTIGRKAFFECEALQELGLPASVQEIGEWAFKNCINLKNMTIPDGVERIGSYALDCTGWLNDRLAEEELVIVNDMLLAAAKDITEAVVPDGITKLCTGAFEDCTALCGVSLPATLKEIGEEAFRGCTALLKINVPDGVTSIGKAAFFECGSLEDFSLPESLTAIGEYAFFSCEKLHRVQVPAAVKSIGAFAYYGTGLKELEVPATECRIGTDAFANTEWFDAQMAETGFVIVNGILITAGDFSDAVIPENVRVINPNAFYGCTELKSVTFPNSLTEIGEYAFYGCRTLDAITLPDSVTVIGESAFGACHMLKSVTLPESLTEIGPYAFYECIALQEVTLPDSLRTLGTNAFSDCASLKKLSLPQSLKGKADLTALKTLKTEIIYR